MVETVEKEAVMGSGREGDPGGVGPVLSDVW